MINGTVLEGTATVGNDPGAPTYDGANGYMYVANAADDTVTVIHACSDVGMIAVGMSPTGERTTPPTSTSTFRTPEAPFSTRSRASSSSGR